MRSTSFAARWLTWRREAPSCCRAGTVPRHSPETPPSMSGATCGSCCALPRSCGPRRAGTWSASAAWPARMPSRAPSQTILALLHEGVFEIGAEDVMPVFDLFQRGVELALQLLGDADAEDLADPVRGQRPQPNLAGAFEDAVNGSAALRTDIARCTTWARAPGSRCSTCTCICSAGGI